MATIQQLIDAAQAGATIDVPPAIATSPGFTPKMNQKIIGHQALTITSPVNGRSVSGVTLRNMKIVGTGSGTAADPYGGEALKTGANWIVEDVDVVDAKGFGIRPYGDGCTFRRVRAIRCALGGWWIGNEDPNGAGTKNQRLENCGAIDCGFDAAGWHVVGGVKFYKTTGCTLDGGEWAGNRFPGIWFDWENKNYTCRNTYVHHNLAGVNPSSWHGGIALECNASGGVVENNYIADNAGGGLVFWENPGAMVKNNTFVHNGLTWRNDAGRGHSSTGNQIINNKVYSTTLAPFPGNTISGTVVLTAEPPKPGTTPPVVPPVTPPVAPPVTPTVPAGAIEYGPDNFGHVWHVSGGILYRDRVKVGDGVLEAFTLAGFFWQRTKYGFHQWRGNTLEWALVTRTDPRPTTPPADNPEIANLKAQIAALDIEVQEANDAIDKLNVELTAADATITTLRGRLKTIEATAGLP